MKTIRSITLLTLALMLPTLSAHAELPVSHPLRHPKLSVRMQPTGGWLDGWLYIHQIAAYALGSDDEKGSARALMERAGYGPKGTHYLYCGEENQPAVADGQPFKTRSEALAYLSSQKVREATYFSYTTSFPKTIPAELTWKGTAFRVLTWMK